MRDVALDPKGRVISDASAVGAKEPYFQGVELPEVVRRHEFDVTVPESWAGLPDPASLRAVVITFPMQLASVEPFWEAFLRRVPSVVAFSSTSVYQVDVPVTSVSSSSMAPSQSLSTLSQTSVAPGEISSSASSQSPSSAT